MNKTKPPEPPVLDEALLDRARAGDREALTVLYEATSLEVYRTVHALVRDEDLTLDIQQDAYLQAFSHLDQLREAAAFLPWLRQIAVNAARAQLRKKRPLLFTELGGDPEADTPELPNPRPEDSPELALDRKENARLIREILGELSDGQRLLLGMYYYEQMSVREIAEKLELSPGTVKAQLYRGRKRVEDRVRRLEEQGVRLFGLSPLPFLLALLRRQEPGPETAGRTMAAVLPETVAVQTGRSFFQTLLGRVCLGLLTASVITGGVLGYRWIRDRVEIGDYQPPETVDSAEDLIVETTEPVVTWDDTPEDLTTEPVTEPETTEPTETTDPEPSSEGAAGPLEPTASASSSTIPSVQNAEIVDWFVDNGASGTSVLTINTKSFNWSIFITVNIRGDIQPTLSSSNPNVASISRYCNQELKGDGITSYQWAVTVLDFGTTDISCELNGASRVIARVDMPKPDPVFLNAYWYRSSGLSDWTMNTYLGQTESLSVRVQGLEAPVLEIDDPSVLSVAGPGKSIDGTWIYIYTWTITPERLGTSHLTVKFQGETVERYTIIIDAPAPIDDSSEDLDEDP